MKNVVVNSASIQATPSCSIVGDRTNSVPFASIFSAIVGYILCLFVSGSKSKK
jgi:hypothetical protein